VSRRSCPNTWVDISAQTASGNRQIDNSVSGLGDVTVVPVMLAWKSGDWQYDFLLPIYAPTGSYELGRLGNTGLNYWTFDPIGGFAYANAKSGFNAAAHVGLADQHRERRHQYKSGNILHFDASIQQVFPLGSGFANVGIEGWYFQQVTCDSRRRERRSAASRVARRVSARCWATSSRSARTS